MLDPWDAFDRLGGWSVHWSRTSHGGLTRWADRVIVLDPRLLRHQERSILSHEVVHAERGPFPRWMLAREEEFVSCEAARRLIPIRALGDAMAWSCSAAEVADELDVDVPTVLARLRGLHPSERAYLRRRTEHHHDHAH